MPRIITLILVVFCSFTFWISVTEAALIDAASCSQSDVQGAINSAVDGDTVRIPPGSCTWSSTITIPGSLSVSIIGAGEGVTTITKASGKRFSMGPYPGEFVRISNMSWDQGGGVTLNSNGNGGVNSFRIDHITQTNLGDQFVFVNGIYYGLIDNNTISGNSNRQVLLLFPGQRLSSMESGGDIWEEDTGLGGGKFVFFEDNVVTFTNPDFGVGAFDGRYGSKLVFRYNTCTNVNMGVHDFENGSPTRGTRAWEYYNNLFISTQPIQALAFTRGGTGVWYGNRVRAVSYTWMNAPVIVRVSRSYSTPYDWPACDGTQDQFAYGENIQPVPVASGGVLLDGHRDSTGWPCRDQFGVGKTDPATGVQALEPVYEWDNYWCTASGANCDPEPDADGVEWDFAPNSSSDHLREGRDYYSDTQKPDYAPYPYPHPLTAGVDQVAPASPPGLTIIPPAGQ